MSEAARPASRTALAVAAMRALHQFHDGAPKILDDPVSARLLGEERTRTILSRMGNADDPARNAMRAHVLLRSRFAEERLESAVRRGIVQAVALGAGLDTFAYRQPPWAARLRLFDVDHPASQDEKRRFLEQAGIGVPANVRFVPIDFETTSLAQGLAAGRVDFAVPTFFSCLGVMTYLTREAIDAIFRVVAGFPSGSEIAFSYRPAGRPPGSVFAASVRAVGEPWISELEPDALARDLRAMGFEGIEELRAEEADRRYFAGRADGLRPPASRSIAAAIAGGGTALR